VVDHVREDVVDWAAEGCQCRSSAMTRRAMHLSCSATRRDELTAGSDDCEDCGDDIGDSGAAGAMYIGDGWRELFVVLLGKLQLVVPRCW
jgi:hypothetical protein